MTGSGGRKSSTRSQAARKAAATRARKKDAASQGKDAPTPRARQSTKETPLNGIVIQRLIDGSNLDTPIQLVGDVKVTEVETILKHALKQFRTNSDLPE